MKSITNIAPMNPTFQVVEAEATSTEATLVIEPLEQGYGHTLGNALRRVMLTSLPGTAITSVRIDGVDHQYLTLDGMSEDIVEFVLNLKQVRIKTDSNDPITLRLSAKGAGTVTANDIECDAGAEIINTDLELATLAKGATLVAEMTCESGVGYQVATEQERSFVGDIGVDAVFSPVLKVNYKVEATRVGRRTDFDKVVMNVITDGTVSPMDALQQAAEILKTQFNQVFNPVVIEEETDEEELSPEEAEVLRLTVEELELPTRIANALRKGGFKTVGSLSGAPRNAIAKVKNLGGKSVDLIQDALQKKGVSLGE